MLSASKLSSEPRRVEASPSKQQYSRVAVVVATAGLAAGAGAVTVGLYGVCFERHIFPRKRSLPGGGFQGEQHSQ